MNQAIYSWVKTHQQLTQYLSKKQNAQQELINLLKSIGISPFNDKSKEGSEYDIELTEIDPFTFFCYIYKYGAIKRLFNLKKIAEKLNFHLPEGDGGIPSANAQKVWLFPWKFKRTNNEIGRLWDFFFKALENKITDEDFADVLMIRNVGKTKLTEALFNILPEKYLPINGPIKPYLKNSLNIDAKFDTYTEYIEILKKVKEKNNKPFYQISHESWEWGNRKANYWIFQCNPHHFDIENALKNEIIDSWTVTAHKDKIKAGDKVIIWVTGENAGCYALAEVKADPVLRAEETNDDSHWKIEKRSEFRADIAITHNLVDAPILKEATEQINTLKNLKVGSQGTNFSATKEEYEAIMEFIAPSEFEKVKSKFDKSDFENYIIYLRKILEASNIEYNDQRVTFSLRKDRMVLTVGQRYCFGLYSSNNKFGFISNMSINDTSEAFSGKSLAFYTKINNFEFLQNHWDKIVSATEIELERTTKSGYRKNNNIEFENYVFTKMNKKYWLFAPGTSASYWDEFYDLEIMGLGWDEIGDLNNFENKDEINKELQKYYEKNQSSSAKMNWDFKENIQVGDIIFSRNGRSEIIGYGIVTSNYYFDKDRIKYKSLRQVDWKLKGNWQVEKTMPISTLVQVKDVNEINKYSELLGIERSGMKKTKPQTTHPLNTIFYGPPGTGKTYNTIKRAAEIIEGRTIENYDEALEIYRANLHNQIEFITFHQNYSYEDFIQGLRPDVESGNLAFEQKDGIFKVMATNALFEFYKKYKDTSTSKSNKSIDLNEAYLDFVEFLKNKENKEFKTSTESIINIVGFTKNENIEFKHKNSSRKYLVSGNRLLKLFESFPKIEKIENVHNDIRNAIGGCNTTVYWVALNEFTNFLDKIPNNKIDSTESYDEIEYETKKNLLSTFNFDQLREFDTSSVSNYVIIIDEINRANISRVFGELITLIEPDKRFGNKMGMEIILPSGDEFTIPNNLYIIGTMNTADKSIALLDIALRRRFTFEAMYPNAEIAEFDREILEKMNTEIINRKGHDFQIGHSYFMGEENKDLVNRMNNKVIPLLLEYFMNDTKEVIEILQKVGLEVDTKSYPLRIIER